MAKFKSTHSFKLNAGSSWKQTSTGLKMCRCGRGYRTERVQHPDAGQRIDGTMDTLEMCVSCAEEIFEELYRDL